MEKEVISTVCVVDGQEIISRGSESAKSVEAQCYYENNNIETVVVAEGIEVIEEHAFSNCNNLKTVVLPKSLKKIEAYAFSDCPKLKKIILPENLETIEDHSFFNCGLKKVYIPASVKEIGILAFAGNGPLKAIIVDENNSSYCSVNSVLYSKNKEIIYAVPQNKKAGTFKPDSNLKTVYGFAFAGCNKIKKVVFPEGMKELGEKAFCGALKIEEVQLPGTLETFGKDVFMGYGVASNRANNKKGIIKGTSGSVAEKAAAEDKVPFVSI